MGYSSSPHPSSISEDSIVLSSVRKQPRGSSTTTATTLGISFSEYSQASSSSSISSTNSAAKSVRFHDASTLESIHEYPQAAFNAKSRNDLFLSVKDQSERGYKIRSNATKQWPPNSDPDKLLQDIRDIPVRERVERLTKMPLKTRGLEKVVCPQFNERTNENIQRVIQSVMEHQYQQRERSQNILKSNERMAQAARELSHSARCMARVLALADQQWVRDELEATTKRKKRLATQERSLTSEDDLMEKQEEPNATWFDSDDDDELSVLDSSKTSLRLSKQVYQIGRSFSRRVQRQLSN